MYTHESSTMVLSVGFYITCTIILFTGSSSPLSKDRNANRRHIHNPTIAPPRKSTEVEPQPPQPPQPPQLTEKPTKVYRLMPTSKELHNLTAVYQINSTEAQPPAPVVVSPQSTNSGDFSVCRVCGEVHQSEASLTAHKQHCHYRNTSRSYPEKIEKSSSVAAVSLPCEKVAVENSCETGAIQIESVFSQGQEVHPHGEYGADIYAENEDNTNDNTDGSPVEPTHGNTMEEDCEVVQHVRPGTSKSTHNISTKGVDTSSPAVSAISIGKVVVRRIRASDDNLPEETAEDTTGKTVAQESATDDDPDVIFVPNEDPEITVITDDEDDASAAGSPSGKASGLDDAGSGGGGDDDDGYSINSDDVVVLDLNTEDNVRHAVVDGTNISNDKNSRSEDLTGKLHKCTDCNRHFENYEPYITQKTSPETCQSCNLLSMCPKNTSDDDDVLFVSESLNDSSDIDCTANATKTKSKPNQRVGVLYHQSGITGKLNKTGVLSQGGIAGKPNQTAVLYHQLRILRKPNQTNVNDHQNGIAGKPKQTGVLGHQSGIPGKPNQTSVLGHESGIPGKPNQTSVLSHQSGIPGKPNQTSVLGHQSGIPGKPNQSGALNDEGGAAGKSVDCIEIISDDESVKRAGTSSGEKSNSKQTEKTEIPKPNEERSPKTIVRKIYCGKNINTGLPVFMSRKVTVDDNDLAAPKVDNSKSPVKNIPETQLPQDDSEPIKSDHEDDADSSQLVEVESEFEKGELLETNGDRDGDGDVAPIKLEDCVILEQSDEDTDDTLRFVQLMFGHCTLFIKRINL